MTGTLDRPLGLALVALSVLVPVAWIATAAIIDLLNHRKGKP